MPVEIQALQLAIQVCPQARRTDCVLMSILLQELEDSKALKLKQFEEIAERIAKANQAGRALLEEHKTVKSQMEEFTSLRDAKQVGVEIHRRFLSL